MGLQLRRYLHSCRNLRRAALRLQVRGRRLMWEALGRRAMRVLVEQLVHPRGGRQRR